MRRTKDTAAAQSVTARLPVARGHGSAEMRSKFFYLLECLKISQASICLATSDFSIIYRHLKEDSYVAIEITNRDNNTWIRLTGEACSAAEAQDLQDKLLHFRFNGADATDDGVIITASRKYSLSKELDMSLLEEAIEQTTAIEKEFAARATALILNTTRHRLNSVEGDLKVAADIQQHMMLSKAQLKMIGTHLDCHAYIVPCKEVGGDFFDIICLSDNIYAILAGDVSGKGVPAAMMMATCSTFLRAYCETDVSPSKIIGKANKRLLDGNDEECMFTTLFMAIVNCDKNTLTYCNAGHNPGILVHQDQSLQELSIVHGPALGVFEDHDFGESTTSFGPGDRLLLYTDGVTESFNSSGDLYGFDRLKSYCTKCPPDTGSRRFLGGILLDINEFSGTELAHDDVTLVTVRRESQHLLTDGFGQTLRIKANEEELIHLKQQIESFCVSLGLESRTQSSLLLVLDELIGNTIRHTACEEKGDILIEVSLQYDSGRLRIVLKDNSQPFDPFMVDEPRLDQELEDREIGGLGLFLVRSLTNHFSYQHEEPWNCITLEFHSCEEDN